MFPEEIVARLESQGVGTFGDDIFIGSGSQIPTGPGPYLSLKESPGAGSRLTQNNTGVERPTAQIVARAVNPVEARAKAQAAYDALGGENNLYNITLSSVFYIALRNRQPPGNIGMDETGERTMYSFNIEAEKYPS